MIDRILESRRKDGTLTFIYHNPRYQETLEERLMRVTPGRLQKTMLHDKRKNYDTCVMSIQ